MPMDKKSLLEKFQSTNPERYWRVELFGELGFKRRRCDNCKKFFWTLTEQRICNDATCRPYNFIGNPPTKKKFDYFETWEVIKKFFEKNGHTSLKSYPVVCRWFPLYFTIAGIVNFYRMTDGRLDFEFPANPSVVNQMCLRFNDVPNVGLNGRSYTCFGMINQQSLFDGKQGYWKDRCIELDFELMTKIFGIEPEEINWIEDAWVGPSAFGTSLEYHVQGLELGNAVFTEFVGTPENYKAMENKVIDMGAGWERFTWISQGTPTSYYASYPRVIDKIKNVADIDFDEKFFLNYSKYTGSLNLDEIQDLQKARLELAKRLKISSEELEKKVSPMEAVYSVADHVRSLVFAISDGGIPSNVAGGYNLRVILRRALSFIEKFKWNLTLEDVADWHVDYHKKMFPDLLKKKEAIKKILELEEKRYRQTKERSRRIVKDYVDSNKIPNEEELIRLYESEGINPEQLIEAGFRIEVPSEFYKKLTERHMKEKEREQEFNFSVSDIPATKQLYYDKPNQFEFKAKVLKVFNENFVVLDQSGFYPLGGGQIYDIGSIEGKEVVAVQKIGNVIIHKISGSVKEGTTVVCRVNKDRRYAVTKHHTATHILTAACRKVLGYWAWQHGAEKDIDKARLDITHFDSLTDEELEKIENEANKIIEKNLKISVEVLPRIKAEQKYGFTIYQGGPIPQKILRIISVGDIDVEACSGTHTTLKSTKEIGFIKILRSKRIADGIVRLEYVAGDVTERYLKEKAAILKEVATKLKVKEEKVTVAIENLFKEWKQLRKGLKK